MIEWYSLMANSLWILGLAVLLARLSFVSYQKAVLPEQQTQISGPDWPQAAGLTLFCMGLLLSADGLFEQAAWGLLAVASLAWALLENRSRKVSKA